MRLWRAVLALVFGLGVGVFVHGYWLVDIFPLGSRRLLVATLAVGVVGVPVGWVLFGWLGEQFRVAGLGRGQKVGLVIASVVLGGLLFFGGTPQWLLEGRYFTPLLPLHTLEIEVNDVGSSSLRLKWMKTSLGDVSFDGFRQEGWRREGDVLVLKDASLGRLFWRGQVGEKAQLVFESEGPVQMMVKWDGVGEEVELSGGEYIYRYKWMVPAYASQAFVLLTGMLLFAVLSLVLVLWLSDDLKQWLEDSSLWLEQPEPFTRAERLFLISIVILAFAPRALNLENLYPAMDEYFHLIAARQILEGAALSEVYQRSLWLVTLPVSLAFRVFGLHLWAARLPGAAFNALGVFSFYFLARKINRRVAMLTAILYATSPWVVTFARVVREYAYYPLLFSVVVYGMLTVLHRLPENGNWKNWRLILKPSNYGWGTLLLAAPLYAIYDSYSTFKLILVAYLVFAFFLSARLFTPQKAALPFLALAAVLFGYLASGNSEFQLTFNPGVLRYFFPAPPQQWYDERGAIIVLLALLAYVLYMVLKRNLSAAFLFTLYLAYLCLFIFIDNPSRPLFRTRYLLMAEIWYVLVLSAGLFLLWNLVASKFRQKFLLKAIVLAGMGVFLLNPSQILVPLFSREPDNPVSEDYHYRLGELHRFMLVEAKAQDVLISSAYGRYASWVGTPVFKALYPLGANTTLEDILTITNANSSGWLVIDSVRLRMLPFDPFSALQAIDGMQYIGIFDDEYLWRWQR